MPAVPPAPPPWPPSPSRWPARSFALALRGTDGRTGPFHSVDAKGRQPRFTWNEADVLNWNTRKPYDF
ncbi:hypothetical protein ACIQ7S_13975 [Streptomyces griseoluteus]|uniref:hypothetical protein n=1 Tax=Streptomyces griseoluteus TaxID=29306 RepID=UPI00332D7B6A